jgi:hypothetical protein
MAAPDLTLEELTRFGIRPEDEGLHPFDPHVEWWNESWFWDWFDDAGTVAGHCRIGLFPAQKRGWVWCFLHVAGEWVAVEELRLPLADFQLPRLAYDRWGLRFAYDPLAALRRGRLTFTGFGRVVSGPRAGMVLPLGVDLYVDAVGAPHTTGRSNVPGHESREFDACRFEQPIAAEGTLRIDDRTVDFRGRGERDHSWGPRPWNMEWTFIVASNDALRLQCVEVRIPNAGRLGVGYLHRDSTQSLSAVEIAVDFDHASLARPLAGRFAVTAEDGTRLAGRLEPITAAEIDITHTFVPPERSIYRRALIRVHLDGGGAPLLGWTEFNYFLPAR